MRFGPGSLATRQAVTAALHALLPVAPGDGLSLPQGRRPGSPMLAYSQRPGLLKDKAPSSRNAHLCHLLGRSLLGPQHCNRMQPVVKSLLESSFGGKTPQQLRERSPQPAAEEHLAPVTEQGRKGEGGSKHGASGLRWRRSGYRLGTGAPAAEADVQGTC